MDYEMHLTHVNEAISDRHFQIWINIMYKFFKKSFTTKKNKDSDLMEFIWSIFDRKYNSLCILYRDKSIPLKEKFYSELYLTI